MYGERRPEFDPDELMRNLRGSLGRFGGSVPRGFSAVLLAFGGLLALALLWGATGFYTVGPEEQAAVRLFGQFRGTEGPGLHWYPPAPIGTRNVEAILETKTMELGFRSEPARDVSVEALMITGDLNIIDIQMVVQYRIVDLGKFLFQVGDPGDAERDPREGRPDGRTLKDATEAALRQVVGQRSIDDALTAGREAVQEDTKVLLQQLMDDYQSGIEILQVVLADRQTAGSGARRLRRRSARARRQGGAHQSGPRLRARPHPARPRRRAAGRPSRRKRSRRRASQGRAARRSSSSISWRSTRVPRM